MSSEVRPLDRWLLAERMSIRQSCNHAFAPERQLSIFPTRARGRHDHDVDDACSQIEKQPILSAVNGVYVDLRNRLWYSASVARSFPAASDI